MLVMFFSLPTIAMKPMLLYMPRVSCFRPDVWDSGVHRLQQIRIEIVANNDLLRLESLQTPNKETSILCFLLRLPHKGSL